RTVQSASPFLPMSWGGGPRSGGGGDAALYHFRRAPTVTALRPRGASPSLRDREESGGALKPQIRPRLLRQLADNDGVRRPDMVRQVLVRPVVDLRQVHPLGARHI